jgi:hypothetical protein
LLCTCACIQRVNNPDEREWWRFKQLADGSFGYWIFYFPVKYVAGSELLSMFAKNTKKIRKAKTVKLLQL